MVDFRANARKSVKKGIDADASRRRRDDTRIQIRKAKREEGLQKRRAMKPEITPNQLANLTSNDLSKEASNRANSVADIPSNLAVLQNANASNDQIYAATQVFRKLLSVENNPPVVEVLNSGALPVLVSLLDSPDSKIQFEASWALTNIASTDHTRVIVEYGAIPKMVKLLLSSDPNVREQCAWCLGNVAGDSVTLRDIVLNEGAMNPLLMNIQNPDNNTLLCNTVWALSNFCRGKPQPPLDSVGVAIPHLAKLLELNNKDALMDALWALSYLSDGNDERIRAVMSGDGVTANVVKLLQHPSASIVTPAVRILGNFVSGDHYETQAVINAGVLDHVGTLLTYPKRSIRKETCWLLSNIAAGTEKQIDKLLCRQRVMFEIVRHVQESEWDVRKEATWVLANIATGGSDEHIHCLVEYGSIEALCGVLEVADTKITLVVLDAIESILRVGKKESRDYVGFVDECDGLDRIEGLQEHENNDVYAKVVKIIETYFGVEENEDENILPSINGGSFAFGLTKTDDLTSTASGTTQQQPLHPFNFSY